MKRSDYRKIEEAMQSCMKDSAHDREHIYRVLYTALDIAGHERGVQTDVLVAACLLHDIGRPEELDDPSLCHAAVGAEKARAFLTENGFSAAFAEAVASCVRTHRFRADRPPQSLEAKILFDADKIDVTGALGIARTLLYKGRAGEPLYTIDENGEISDGADDAQPSFLQEYKRKLEPLYTAFYTRRGTALAMQRRHAASAFYESLLGEAREARRTGSALLGELLTDAGKDGRR